MAKVEVSDLSQTRIFTNGTIEFSILSLDFIYIYIYYLQSKSLGKSWQQASKQP